MSMATLQRQFKIYIRLKKCGADVRAKVCVKGESNPQLNLGRVPCYHYTINALEQKEYVTYRKSQILL